MKDLTSVRRLIWFDDEVSLNRIENTAKRKIGEAVYSKILQLATYNNISTWESFKRVHEINELKDAAEKSCYEFYEMNLTFKEFKYISINDLVDKILDTTNYSVY